jgi:probable F420-dependent oxidoreductase
MSTQPHPEFLPTLGEVPSSSNVSPHTAPGLNSTRVLRSKVQHYSAAVKFGIIFANIGPLADPVAAARFAKAAESAGFESLWTVEHVVVPSGYQSTYPYDPSGKMPGPEDSDIPDPLIWLSYVAASTSQIRLGTGVMILPQRNPLVLAKEVATLDHLSGGRVELGVGVGWLEEEFDALGVEFRHRGQRTDEYIEAMRALWSGAPTDYHGEFVNFDRCITRPAPMGGSVPIHVGGHSAAAARRAGRLGDGFFPGRGTGAEWDGLIGELRVSAEAAGRDPDAIELTSAGSVPSGDAVLAEVERLEGLGVSRFVVPSFFFWADPENSLAAYGEEVIARAG